MSTGNPFVEQRSLTEGSAVVPLVDRGVLTLTGPDRLAFLDALFSQRLTDLQPGESREALLLDPNGRVEHAVRILTDSETVWLLVDEDKATSLHEWLTKMIFHSQVEVVDASSDFLAVGVVGARIPLPLEQIAEQRHDYPLVWRDPWSAVAEGGWQYASDSSHPAHDWAYSEVIIRRINLPVLTSAAQDGELNVATLPSLEALRIAAWRPRIATEGDERLLPHEVDWLRTAVHLSKGCYRGQETVAKVHNLGHPPRRLVFLDLDGSTNELIEAGNLISTVDGTEIGRVTSVAMHWQDGPIALGIIKRNVPEDVELIVTTTSEARLPAKQRVIVPRDAGATVTIDRELRRNSQP